MLVTINPEYKGTYGHYVAELKTVQPKKAGCEPFDEDPVIAHKQIKNGVMVAVDPATVPVETAKTEPVKAEPAKAEPDKEDADTDLKDLSIAELRAAAKARGINAFGVKKTTLIELIEEYDAKETVPVFEAMDPE